MERTGIFTARATKHFFSLKYQLGCDQLQCLLSLPECAIRFIMSELHWACF